MTHKPRFELPQLAMAMAFTLSLAGCGGGGGGGGIASTPGLVPSTAAPAAPATPPEAAAPPAATAAPVATSPKPTWRGVSLAGAEFGESKLPGIHGQDYIYPANDSVGYYQRKGMNLVRLPFLWERLQPQLNQELDSNELERLKSFVAAATAGGTDVLLDPHNYARWHASVIGSAEVPQAAFADLWRRLALQFKDNPRVLFGLMNEPHDMSTETWVAAANAGIAAIRATGAANVITVPGNGWTGAHSWFANSYGTPNAEAMLAVTDSGNNLVFEVHQYLDGDSAGKLDTCVSETIGVERLRDFTGWLKTHGKRGMLGEFAGGNNETCRLGITAMLQHMKDNDAQWAGWAWWAGGPWWGSYPFSIEPQGSGDRPQMNWLTPFLN